MTAQAQGALTGTRKAAIFLAALGEEAASLVLHQLSEAEIEAVTAELATLDLVQPEVAQKVLEEISEASETVPPLRAGTEFARQLVLRAFGEENGGNLVRRIPVLNQQDSPIYALRAADPQLLATLLQEEHPQAIALILAQLEAVQASALLTKLSPEIAGEVLKRMAQLKQFSPELAMTVSSVLQRKLQSFGDRERQTFPGVKSAAEMMTRVNPTTATPLLEALEQEQPNLAIEIRNLMFTFEDLITVPEVSLREWLSAVDKKTLALALKGASEEVANPIMKGMSTRAAQMLKEDIEALGPTRGKEIAKAQEETITIARQLESEGKLVLTPDGDDEYVV